MPPLKDYLASTDKQLVEKYLEDPEKFQEIRKIIEPKNEKARPQIKENKVAFHGASIRIKVPAPKL